VEKCGIEKGAGFTSQKVSATALGGAIGEMITMDAKKGVVSCDPVQKVGKSNCRFEPRQTEK